MAFDRFPDLDGLRELAVMPEWSAFFRAAVAHHALHFWWRNKGDQWWAAAFDFKGPLDQSLRERRLSEVTASEKFEALRLAIEGVGPTIHQAVWDAFYAFRAAAGGTPANIEDLL